MQKSLPKVLKLVVAPVVGLKKLITGILNCWVMSNKRYLFRIIKVNQFLEACGFLPLAFFLCSSVPVSRGSVPFIVSACRKFNGLLHRLSPLCAGVRAIKRSPPRGCRTFIRLLTYGGGGLFLRFRYGEGVRPLV